MNDYDLLKVKYDKLEAENQRLQSVIASVLQETHSGDQHFVDLLYPQGDQTELGHRNKRVAIAIREALLRLEQASREVDGQNVEPMSEECEQCGKPATIEHDVGCWCAPLHYCEACFAKRGEHANSHPLNVLRRILHFANGECDMSAEIRLKCIAKECDACFAKRGDQTQVDVHEPPLCEVCDSTEDLRQAPAMTGVPFSAPKDEQRYICGPCVCEWMEGAGTSVQIRKARGIAEPS